MCKSKFSDMVTRTTDRQSEKTRENGVDGKNQENLEYLCAKKDQVLFT